LSTEFGANDESVDGGGWVEGGHRGESWICRRVLIHVAEMNMGRDGGLTTHSTSALGLSLLSTNSKFIYGLFNYVVSTYG
jgi:hypothetical protein